MAGKFDAIVIGTGQSGPSIAQRMTKEGMKVAILERKLFGGTCVNVGCIPTKALVASARAAHVARRAADFGVTIGGDIAVDMKRVKARKDAIVRYSNENIQKWLKSNPDLTVIHGHGRFESPNTVSVNGRLLEAPKIIINVGGHAFVPEAPGIGEIDYLTSSTMMEVDFLPAHLIVIGGSYIGLEFAQMYRRFGSRVTVIEMADRLIPREDADVSAAVKAILEKEGIDVRLNAECISYEKRGNDVAVGVKCGGGPKEVVGSHLLLAVGRRPNTHDLGLDKAGVDTDAHGYIVVDDKLHTNVEGIFAVGDVNGRGAFTHTSYNEYEILVANMFDGDDRKISDRITAYGLFIDPPLGRVGQTEREVRQSGTKALIATMQMTRVGRARERSETEGFMKILVDAETKKILGASFLGTEGDEAVQSVLDVMYADAPYTVITRAMHIHPTVSELIPTLLEGLKPLE
jgi:pyruvate/2-oxoglutarate dehydrogenase complex dihydrolipoamide dehydrogenase (E3) component